MMHDKFWVVFTVGFLSLTGIVGCDSALAPTQVEREAEIYLIPFKSITHPVYFYSFDGTRLAGQLDLPLDVQDPPLVFVIHHSGAVDRNAYQYLAARLVPGGYAVFRFDKRGTGQSDGSYGCCEEEDALAAYQAATALEGYDPDRVFVIAQSIGTQILSRRFDDFQRVRPVRGVVLLSSLLKGKEVLNIQSPLFIIVSDSEPDLAEITEAAAEAHRQMYGEDVSYFIAPHTEHTLFDVSGGPMDWSDPRWPLRFSEEAAESLLTWLKAHR